MRFGLGSSEGGGAGPVLLGSGSILVVGVESDRDRCRHHPVISITGHDRADGTRRVGWRTLRPKEAPASEDVARIRATPVPIGTMARVVLHSSGQTGTRSFGVTTH